MSDQLRHKESLQIDEELARRMAEGLPMGQLLFPPQIAQESLIATAKRAQEDKDRFLGRLPPKIEPQANPAISRWQHNWSSMHMNNKRELGPGDTGKK